MVGLFINTLPVRVRVPREATAAAWLAGFQDKLAELRDYEHSPLVQVQGYSELARGVPLFESQVAFENYPSVETLLEGGAGLRVTDTRMSSQAHYPITFNAVSRNTIGLRISYDRGRFERAAIDRMLVHLRTLLGTLASGAPEGRVRQLPILPEEETRRLLVEWNETRALAATGADATVHQLFAEQAARGPGGDRAGGAGAGGLTYRDSRCANFLAEPITW